MKSRVYQMLKKATGLPIQYMLRPTQYPSLTYSFYGMGGALYGDGDITAEGGRCQVDVWDKSGNYDTCVQAIRIAIKAEFGTNAEWEEDFEPDTKIYHVTIDFEILKGDE